MVIAAWVDRRIWVRQSLGSMSASRSDDRQRRRHQRDALDRGFREPRSRQHLLDDVAQRRARQRSYARRRGFGHRRDETQVEALNASPAREAPRSLRRASKSCGRSRLACSCSAPPASRPACGGARFNNRQSLPGIRRRLHIVGWPGRFRRSCVSRECASPQVSMRSAPISRSPCSDRFFPNRHDRPTG